VDTRAPFRVGNTTAGAAPLSYRGHYPTRFTHFWQRQCNYWLGFKSLLNQHRFTRRCVTELSMGNDMSAKQIRAAWIQGGAAKCEVLPPLPSRVFPSGAPRRRTGVARANPGRICSANGWAPATFPPATFSAPAQIPGRGERSPALEAALGYMKRGDPGSRPTVLDLVRERTGCLRCRSGFLLDGFPRTVAQAEAFAKIMRRSKFRSTPC